MQASTPVLRARRAAGLTICELARRAGVCRATVYKLEAGAPARLGTYRRVADVLGVPAASLLPDLGTGAAAEKVPA